jgi:hypothetical protein
MKKLKLDLDSIQVASFEAAPALEEQGTVQAHLATPACPITGGINSCWCSEIRTCDCTI